MNPAKRLLSARILLPAFVLVLAAAFVLPILVDTTAAETTDTEHTLSALSYYLDWDWGEAELDADGSGWTVTNDLGYEIHVDEGYLVTRSIELVACPHEHASDSTTSALLLDLIQTPTAFAGHGGGDHDLSRISVPFVESLAAPADLFVETVFIDEPSYCQAHYLVAEGIDGARNMPEDSDMVGTSLQLAGTYQIPGQETPTEFALSVDLAWGTLNDLGAGGLDLSETESISLIRSLGTLFDGVDFETMGETEQGMAVLRSLTSSLRVVTL